MNECILCWEGRRAGLCSAGLDKLKVGVAVPVRRPSYDEVQAWHEA